MIHELFRLFNWAGSEWVLAVLGILSVLVVAVVLARWLELARLDKVSARFWDECGDRWLHGELSAWRERITELKQKYPCLEIDAMEVMKKAESHSNGGGPQPERVVGAYLEHRRMKLEKYVGLVGTVGANAAFVGLLGTVLGIIRAFHDLAVTGASGLDSIGGGIAEALVATAVGLCVAIPAVIFYNVLSRRITTILRRAESVVAFADAPRGTHGR